MTGNDFITIWDRLCREARADGKSGLNRDFWEGLEKEVEERFKEIAKRVPDAALARLAHLIGSACLKAWDAGKRETEEEHRGKETAR